MKILLLYQRAHKEGLREYLTKQHRKEDLLVILEVNTHVDPPLIRNNIVTKRFEDYISDQELLNMDQDILYFANEWYKVEGKDITWYENVSFGKATVYDFMIFFNTLLTGITYAFRAALKEQPDKVLLFLDHSFLQKIFAYILRTYFPSIRIEYLKTSERHRDFTERQNPQLHSFSVQTKEKRQASPHQPKWPFLSRFYQRALIELDILRHYVDFRHRYHRRIFLRDLVASYDCLDARLKANPKNRILHHVIHAKSDYKHFARTQRKARKELAERWTPVKENDKFRQFFTYMPECPGKQSPSSESEVYQICKLWDIVEPHFQNFFTQYMPELVDQLVLFRRWATREHLSLIAVNRTYGAAVCRLWLMAARQLGIPTVGMFDSTFHQFLPNRENHVEPISDYIAVWGNSSVKTALSRGFTREQIRVIGASHLKALQETAKTIDLNAYRKKWGIQEHRKIITFTPSGGSPLSAMPTVTFLDQEDIFRIVGEVSRQLQEHHFIMKFHPRNDLFEGKGSLIRKIEIVESYQLDNVTIISSQESIVYSVAVASLVMTLGGSTGLDAIYLGKPLIFINFNQRDRFEVDFVSTGAAIGVYRPEDLSKTIKEVLTDKDLQEKMKRGRELFLRKHITEVPHYDKIIERLAKIR